MTLASILLALAALCSVAVWRTDWLWLVYIAAFLGGSGVTALLLAVSP